MRGLYARARTRPSSHRQGSEGNGRRAIFWRNGQPGALTAVARRRRGVCCEVTKRRVVGHVVSEQNVVNSLIVPDCILKVQHREIAVQTPKLGAALLNTAYTTNKQQWEHHVHAIIVPITKRYPQTGLREEVQQPKSRLELPTNTSEQEQVLLLAFDELSASLVFL